jgi:beta-1,2-mannobiose phosphorylase / 1,2-beta-oligomannan phosphorylase
MAPAPSFVPALCHGFYKKIQMMKTIFYLVLVTLLFALPSCKSKQKTDSAAGSADFPAEITAFTPYEHNPVFQGTNTETWDNTIRERGFILLEDGKYKMWYTGYHGDDNTPKYLGYATSDDGIHWTKNEKNPIFSEKWTEDMFVTRQEGKYYMYAEGKNDIAHLLTSDDGLKWQEQGDLIILTVKGDTIPGPYGTPSVWVENGKWYLFYERDDKALWIATSTDHKTWTNLQDEPVLTLGPGAYDSAALAANQVIRYKDKYYVYYHGSSNSSWNVPGNTSIWTSNVAMSTDLIHWVKYPGNPIVEGDHSSPIVVPDGNKFRLYTMHHQVWLYFSK